MKTTIMDKGHIYQYDKMLHVNIINGKEMVIDYLDENGVKHEEVGDIPEYLTIDSQWGDIQELKELNECYLEEIRSFKRMIMKLKGETDL